MSRADIVTLDRARVWHPYTAMDEHAARDPFVITRANGSRLFDADGRSYLDGNSSWYVATLGHAHPRLVRRVQEQVASLAHVSMAGVAHEQGARLADALSRIAPRGDLCRAFFTDDGSTAVEVAVKIAVQHWQQSGAPEKTRFLALDGAFHGDSIGAASLGGVEVFRRPFASVLFDCVHVPFPDESGYERAFEVLAKELRETDDVAAVVVEPVVQGAAGMRIYDAAYLRELRALTAKRDVLLIIDEVFAGYGRTGPMWGADHASVCPDIMCVGKAMSPFLPMGAALVTERVERAFRGGKERALMYGHTLCGNPLGAALALEVLDVYREEDVLARAKPKAARIARAFESLREVPGIVRTRWLGMIGAADLEDPRGGAGGYLGTLGWRVHDEARKRGAYLRPLGDTVYVTPPLTIPDDELALLLDIVTESVKAVLAT
jgi:adenosylmethionine-8-amino-7-oxononanoate aminotransferase